MGREGISPSNGRFRKGRSGNPRGRPKGTKQLEASVFEVVFDSTLTVVQNGVSREVTVEEALQLQIYKEAIGGSRMAIRELLKMIEKREKALATRIKQPVPRTTLRLEPVDPENADAALQILGIATRDASRDNWGNAREPLLLELWAVQAALSCRRGGKRLNEQQISEIKRCTRDATKLRWPAEYSR